MVLADPAISGVNFILLFGAVISGLVITLLILVIIYLIRSKDKFSDLYIKNCSSGIIAIDNNEITVIYNQAAEDLMGVPRKEVLDKPFGDLMKKKLGSGDSILLNTLQTGREYRHVEAVIDTTSGPMHVMAYTILMRDSRDKVIGSLLSIRDISEQKQLEEKVFQAEKYDLVGEIAAGLANEVRNPLTSVHGLLQLLESKVPSDEAYKTYFTIMHEELNRLNFIISEFIMLSRPIVPIRSEINLHDIIDEMLVLCTEDILKKDITVSKDFFNNLPTPQLDREQIKHVFLNLLSNAIAAVDNKGQINIKTSFDKISGTVDVLISDNGCGMDIQVIDRIYDPFFTTKVGNTGLGLTVSKRIVHNHGGKIEVNSIPGQGTTFKVTMLLK